MSTDASFKDISLSRPYVKHERYTLKLRDNNNSAGPVYVKATPLTGDYSFKNKEEDTIFNLSQYIGINNNRLVWGHNFSEFEKNAKSFDVKERWLTVELADNIDEPSRKLNLDDYLDLYEYYDVDSGELKAKLGIKPESTKRSIILCFDGTSNHFSNQNTNVIKLVELLKKDDPERQLVYYQPGVGTYTSPGFFTEIEKNVATIMDQGGAWYLYQHIIDGYRYLMQTYRDGDQICIFGFSRGAYTARALAGMLHSVGLLPRHNLEQVAFAYEVYKYSQEVVGVPGVGEQNNSELGQLLINFGSSPEFSSSAKDTDPRSFKRAFCIPVTIALLGVWDTVGSVGIFKRETLPWIEYNPSVRHFRQALSLDENRGNFIPSLWDHTRTGLKKHQAVDMQDAHEVWFKGSHADVGGGAPPTEKVVWNVAALIRYNLTTEERPDVHPYNQTPRLSNITLRWMVRQCTRLRHVPILFDSTMMHIYRHSGILETPGSDVSFEKLDARDIAAKPYLAAEQNDLVGWGWWLLDRIPVPKLAQIDLKQPSTVWSPNNGAPRVVRHHKGTCISIHSSVSNHLKDMDAEKTDSYAPAAQWKGWDDRWPKVAEGSSINDLDSSNETDEKVLRARSRLHMVQKP